MAIELVSDRESVRQEHRGWGVADSRRVLCWPVDQRAAGAMLRLGRERGAGELPAGQGRVIAGLSPVWETVRR